MSHNILSVIETLFFNHGKLHQPVDFEWRLIYRYRRPLLLLPTSMADARAGLNLYAAQRFRAKILRSLLPVIFQTPAAKFFEHIRFRADASSEIMQFMARQLAIPAIRISAVAIMFGGMDYKSRVILLLCDEKKRPVRVVKAGLNPEWRKVTDQEADFLEKIPPNTPGHVPMTGRLSTPTLSAFAMDYFSGHSPTDDAGMEHLFHAWLNPGPFVPLERLHIWREFASIIGEADPDRWHILNTALAGKTIRTTLYHGDFSPWNIRVTNSQKFQIFDWERGQLQGIPGWDWFHFVIQTSILAKKYSAERVAAEVEQLIHSPRFKKYAVAAEISDIVEPLLLVYLLHYLWKFKPSEGGKTTRELFDLLFARWRIKL